MTETNNIRIRKTWLLCQVLNILERDGRFRAVVTPYELGHRYDIRFPITPEQERALRPYVAERKLVCIAVAIKQAEHRKLLALTMLDSYPVYGVDASSCMAYVTPFFDCAHSWTK